MSAPVRFCASRSFLLHLLLGAGLAAAAHAAPLTGLTLQDQRGTALSQSRLDGHVTLVHFIYTQCSTSCPLQLRELAAVHDGLPAQVRQRTRFLSVTVDPLTDTPATLAAFARRMDAQRSGWTYATGTPGEIGRLVERLHAMNPTRPDPGPADHRTSLYLFDRHGELIQRHLGVPVDRPRLIAEISRLALGAPAPR